MRRHLATLAVVLAALAPLAACGDDGGDESVENTTTAPTEDPVAGRTFESTELEGTAPPLVDGVPIRLTFADDELTVEAGCDPITGSYTVEGPILVVRDLESAVTGCTPGLIAESGWITDVLTARPVFTPTPPDGLVLSDEDYTLTMTEVGADGGTGTTEPTDAAGVTLAGPTWTLDYLSVDDSVVPIPAGVTPTITFADDESYAVAAGCNTGDGSYTPPEIGKPTMSIEPPTLTRQRCDEAIMEVEDGFVAGLDGEVRFSIEDGRLTIAAPDGTGLGFTEG